MQSRLLFERMTNLFNLSQARNPVRCRITFPIRNRNLLFFLDDILCFYLIGFNNDGNIDVYDYGISNPSEFTFSVTTTIDPLLDSPTIAWNPLDNQLYGIDLNSSGDNILVGE